MTKEELELENLRLRNVLRITHELYVNASVGYGFYRPDDPHNYSPDLEQVSKEEIYAHSQACEDYAAGRPIRNESWGIGTYCDEFKPAVELLSTPPSTEALSALVEKAYAKGQEDMRERCVAEADRQGLDEPYGHAKFRCANIAEAIRALPTGNIKLEDLL